MIKTEKRWREGKGEKYMQDGQRVRCQSQSKNKLREYRILHQDWTTSNDDLWPNCQCVRAAVPGVFACNLHGGLTPRRDKPQSLMDVIPIDLSEKFKILIENPDYISSRTDILLMMLRQWDLMEKLGEQAGSKEDWEKIKNAAQLLKRGEVAKADTLLTAAVESHKTKDDVWAELYKVENVIKDLRSTETKVARDLKSMASADQVERLMDRVFSIVMRGAENYVTNPQEQLRFIQYVVAEFTAAVNISPATIAGFLSTGTNEDL